MPYPRYNHIDVIWDLPEFSPEWDHVQGVFAGLEPYLVDLGFADSFVFYVTAQTENIAIGTGNPVVVYEVQDREHEIPTYINDVFMAFKNYPPIYPAPDALRVGPLGCNKEVSGLPLQLMKDRSLDLFFAGDVEHRDDFFTVMDEAYPLSRRGSQIDIERTFGLERIYTPEIYGHKMAQAKLALCPRGGSHETYRIYEAMRAGCVVIAARQLTSWYTEGWPVIEIDDWRDFKDLASSLLRDEKRLQELSLQTRVWWEEKCSEEAVAHYMARELSVSLMKQSI